MFTAELLQVPTKLTKELQLNDWIEKLFARVTLRESSTTPFSDGSKIIFKELCYP